MKRVIPAAAAGIALAGTLASASLVYAHDGGVGMMQRPRIDKTEIQAMIAEDLGITVDELKENGSQIQAMMQARAKAEIAARVASGKITQEQADKILERLADHPKQGKKMIKKFMHGMKFRRVDGNGTPPPHFERFKEAQAQ